eukprot:6695523-Prymnesium_polylepis.1
MVETRTSGRQCWACWSLSHVDFHCIISPLTVASGDYREEKTRGLLLQCGMRTSFPSPLRRIVMLCVKSCPFNMH